MPRSAANPTDTTPYLAKWTSASEDLSATTANVAPIELPPDWLDDSDFLVLNIATDTTGARPTINLVLADREFKEDEGEPTVVACMEVRTATDVRRTHFDNGGGGYVTPPIQFDIRGLRSHGYVRQWYLCLADIDTASNVYLLRWEAISDRGS